jgi:hypothetical protein
MAIVLDGTSGITAPNATVSGTVQGSPVRGGLVSGTAVASTSGTSIDFTGIPSWAKRITVMFSLVSTNGTSGLLVQIGDSGGVETTGYASVTDVTGVVVTTGYSIYSTAAARITSGAVALLNVSGNTWVASGQFVQTDSGFLPSVGGNKTLSDTLTQVRITTVNGTDTFDAGTINIMYEG